MQPHLDLIQLCKLEGLPKPLREYKFHPERKWRIDYSFLKEKLAIEINGGIFAGGRHVRGYGFLNDMEKLNNLSLLGWSILQFTPQQVNSGEAISVIKEWFNRREAK